MGDAQIDGGDTGGNIENSTSNWIGADDNSDAVRFYGIACLLMGYLVIPVFRTLDGNYWVWANRAWFATVQQYYLPVGMGWLLVSFFDSAFMRAVFRDLVFISMLAPFFFLWHDIATYALMGEGGGYDEVMFWVWGAVYVFHSLFQGVVQIIVLPKVIEWTHESDYLANDQEKKLLAIMF